MKKIIKCLMLFVVISISVYIAYAGVPDEDKDGIPGQRVNPLPFEIISKD